MNVSLGTRFVEFRRIACAIGSALMFFVAPVIPASGHRVCAAVFAAVFLLAVVWRDLTVRMMEIYPDWNRVKAWVGVLAAVFLTVNVSLAVDPKVGLLGLAPLILAVGGYFAARKVFNAAGILMWLAGGGVLVALSCWWVPVLALSSFPVFWAAASIPAFVQAARGRSARVRAALALCAVPPGVLLATTQNIYVHRALVAGMLVWAFYSWRAGPLVLSRDREARRPGLRMNAAIIAGYVAIVTVVAWTMPRVMGFLPHHPDVFATAARTYMDGGVLRMIVGRGAGHDVVVPNDVWYVLVSFGAFGLALCAHFIAHGFRGLWKAVRSGARDAAGLAGVLTVLLLYGAWYSLWTIPFLMAVVGVLFGARASEREPLTLRPAPLRLAITRTIALVAGLAFAWAAAFIA